jgi:hypothetical protein
MSVIKGLTLRDAVKVTGEITTLHICLSLEAVSFIRRVRSELGISSEYSRAAEGAQPMAESLNCGDYDDEW